MGLAEVAVLVGGTAAIAVLGWYFLRPQGRPHRPGCAAPCMR